jgi:hypothetical protein
MHVQAALTGFLLSDPVDTAAHRGYFRTIHVTPIFTHDRLSAFELSGDNLRSIDFNCEIFDPQMAVSPFP